MKPEQEQAFSEFVAARSRHLLHTAYLLTASPAGAEDLLRMALTRAYRRWGRSASEDPEGQVRRTLVAAHLSRRRRTQPAAAVTDPVLRALASLPRRQRAILVLRDHDELPAAAIADLLGCSTRAVTTATARATETLRARLELTEPPPELRPIRSPALEPAGSLPTDVRRGARQQRRRARGLSAAVAAAVVAAGLLAGPGLVHVAQHLRHRSDATAAVADPRFPAATSDVLTLLSINGATILSWYEGDYWCTATTHAIHRTTCLGPVDPEHHGFSWVVPAHTPTVSIGDQHAVAGIAPPGASRVIVHMRDGREFESTLAEGRGYLRPVWSALLVDDTHGPVGYYAAFDQLGREIARKAA